MPSGAPIKKHVRVRRPIRAAATPPDKNGGGGMGSMGWLMGGFQGLVQRVGVTIYQVNI